jgi:hypothetical protein
MAKEGFYSHLASDEITTHGYRALPLQSVRISRYSCLRLPAVWDPLLIRWSVWEWASIGLVLVEPL